MKSFFLRIRILLLGIALFLLITAVSTAVFTWLQIDENRQIKTSMKENEKEVLDLNRKLLQKDLHTLYSDLLYISYSFENEVLTAGGYDYQAIEEDWKMFLSSKTTFFKIRYIDLTGNEKIRLNYYGNSAILTRPTELENKADRYYFQEALQLNRTQIHFSKLDLNVENGQIEIPYRPTIRLSKKVYDENGENKGIIVLSYDASTVLESVRDASANSFGSVFLVNENGYWLLNQEDRSKEWAFMAYDTRAVCFPVEYPEEWNLFREEKGSFVTDNGLFTYRWIELADLYYQNLMFTDVKPVVAAEDRWLLVSFISSKYEEGMIFQNGYRNEITNALSELSITLLAILLFSELSSLLITIIIRSKAKVRHFSFDTLTKVYNRRAGFERLEKEYRAGARKKRDMCICFIDVNGLKEVNDKYGHDDGDALIREIIDTINKYLNSRDFIIRIGGDEFLIVLIGINSEQAEMLWDSVKATLDDVNHSGKNRYYISVSHGIRAFTYSSDEYIDRVVNEADERMYEEKRAFWSCHIR